MTARWKILMAVGLLSAGGLCFLLWIAMQSPKASPAGLALDRQLAELRARGEPLTAEDMGRRFPDPPLDQDAQTVLQKALFFTPGSRPTTNLPVLSAPEPDRRALLDAALMRDVGASAASIWSTSIIAFFRMSAAVP